MFDNNLGKEQKTSAPQSYYAPEDKPSFFARNKIIFIAIGVFLLVVALGFFIYKAVGNLNKNENAWSDMEEQGDIASLPPIEEIDDSNNQDQDDINSAKAEYLSFADFYDKTEEDVVETKSYNLPINIKTDVSNYYEVSRKIDLDDNIDDFDSNGFAVLENPFSATANNFFSLYNALRGKDVPVVITSDFLVYYYQNLLKETFKEIENNVFYKEIWNINKKFFDIADARYRERLEATGIINDPILEAQRLEAAYFATALELLKPRGGQTEEAYSSDDKFSLNDSNEFYFVLPEYLRDDVNKEVELILLHKEESKSPVFRYARNYKDFTVPLNYQATAKLFNFYLAEKWMNSVFPLYYKGDYCPECLLAKEDWMINMATASYVAEDFSRNQDLKNRWARIYKVVSFFMGLRHELTYLHYDDVLKQNFGDDYDIAKIFAQDNPDREKNISILQKGVSDTSFSRLEGSFDRTKPENRRYIGMRMLQESYWPNDYIFEKLVNPNVGANFTKKDIRKYDRDLYITGCPSLDNKNSFYRCRGFGLDIISLVHEITGNDFYKANTDYINYKDRAGEISGQLKSFDKYSWHNNNFWNTLNITNSFLVNGSVPGLNFSTNKSWENKNIDTALGAWVNMQLPEDAFVNASYGIGSASLSVGDYDYVEPNINLANELSANVKMLQDMLLALGVLKETDFAYLKLDGLNSKLTSMKNIMIKELKNETLTYDDKTEINNVINQFAPIDSKEKTLRISFPVDRTSILESINGVKLLIIVYEKEGRKYLAVGPVFNYKESLR